MATIDVSPDGLREAGNTLDQARETLVTNGNVHLLHGIGDDQHISTGGFPPGAFAQEQLSQLYGQAQEAFNNIFNNFIAISSGLYLVADLFNRTDQDQALKFAFLDPDTAVPDWLPVGVDPKVTSQQMREETEAKQALNGGALPDGWTRRERETSPYTRVTELLDENGKVVGSIHTTTVAGRQTVAYYNGDNQVVSTRVETKDGNGGYLVQTYDGRAAEENLVRAQHKVVDSDGFTRYHTDVYDETGELAETTDQVVIAPEPQAALPGEDLSRTIEEQQYLADANQMYEHAIEGPARPEDYEGEHNRIRSY